MLILVFETAMEKFKNDFDLGLELLRTFTDFVADWASSTREKIYAELKKLAEGNVAKTIKLEWIYLLLDNPGKVEVAKTFERNLSKCEKALVSALEGSEDKQLSRELLKQWLSLWICQKNFSSIYNQAGKEDYKKAAESHFERLSNLNQFNDLVSLDRKIIDGIFLFPTRAK